MGPIRFDLMLDSRDTNWCKTFWIFRREENYSHILCPKSKFFSQRNNGINHDRDSIAEFLGTESMKTCTAVNLNILTWKYGCD